MAVGRMLIAGRYRLLEPVGSGGMGRVWLARDEMLDRDVAVKEFVPPDWMTDDEQARLRDRTLREARSAGRLNHPHVVRIYDVVHAEDLPWIVMEYVPSRSLHQVIQEDGPYSPVAGARIGLAVLDALSAAHRAGVLHRDVKPHNVLIGTDGRVVLTDFGLATFVDDGAVTGPGLVVGSPQYVSPERARDGASTVESDMWSLGATLYAAIEGRSPYQRSTAMATLMALATEPPDPPERAGPVAPVLLGLLRHDPAARLTASEVERRLRMVVAAAPGAGGVPSPRRPRGVAVTSSPPAPPAPPVSPSESVSPPEKARPRSMLMAAGLVLVALLGIGAIVASFLVQRTDVPGASPSGSASPSLVVAGFSPSLCSSAPATVAAVRMPQKNAARGVSGWDLLSGWSYFSDGSGFHLAVPDGWTFRKFGSLYCFREPGGQRVLSLDTGRNPSADPVSACRTEASRLVGAGALPGYAEISIEAKPLLNKAADWEYRFAADDGTKLHARTRWFASSGKGYALSWATQEIDWTGDLAKINMLVSTFYADRPS
ncbi:serine/threonine-protein kinase [Actinoplanes sp. NPDC026619]|uniref:serine/threonine-protein kinase n=1 Tax=Actinoplanes sp. NPDC026619 TaxID=3155798 RepID=UPI0033C15DBF